MFSTAAGKQSPLSETRKATRSSDNPFSRKIWLPKLLYNLLPYFYVTAGIASFLATLYISEWFWVLPHYLLFSVACMHMGLLIYRRRRRHARDA
jgi:hypothetical protein